MITPKVLKESQIALLAIDGNLFPAKDFPHFDGYEEVGVCTFVPSTSTHSVYNFLEDGGEGWMEPLCYLHLLQGKMTFCDL